MINRLLIFLLFKSLLFVSCSEIEQFQNDAYSHFNQFHILPAERKIIVGTRDYLLQFNFDDISKPTDAINLEPDINTFNLCKVRGQTDKLCRNFILVLFTFQDKRIDLQPKSLNSTNSILEHDGNYLIACGTFAFKPMCTIHHLDDLNKINRTIQGSLICPYSHLHKFTLIHSKEGDLYFGGPADLLEKNKLLVRNTLENDQKNFVQTFLDNSKMLYSDSKFIYSFETKEYVYVLFRETSVENLICTRQIVSRIGRVCKNDPGTKSSMGRFWNTFIKAKINCSFNHNETVYLDEIVDAYYLNEESKLFVVFKTNYRSAVCTYDLNEIESKFSDAFSYQATADTIWSRYEDRQAMKQFQCKLPDKQNLAEFMSLQQNQRKYQIAYQSIDTTLTNLLIHTSSSNYKEIQVDLIKQMKPKLLSIYIVYLITGDNYLVKHLMNLNDQNVCFLGKTQVLSESEQILKFKLSTKMKTILIGSTRQFLKIQISNCEYYSDRTKCLVESRDPYCVWNSFMNKCEHVHQLGDTSPDYLEQPNFASLCEATIPKKQDTGARCTIDGEPGKECLCRYDSSKRNPFEVGSCTIDGGWSDWSEWSECKSGKKERFRQCNNPKPFKGKQCAGKSKEIETCLFLYHTTAWTDCSAKCGLGYQTRQNLYINDEKIFNTTELRECRGIDCENEECRCVECNNALNSEINKCVGEGCNFSSSIWSPCGSSCAVGFQFKQINKFVFLKRKCDTRKKCLNWSEWSEWSRCSEKERKKSKIRYCYGQECAGEYKTAIVCDPKNDSTTPEELISLYTDDSIEKSGFHLSTGTFITFLFLFFIFGLISGPALVFLYNNKNYFERQRQKNLSLRSVSSPLIRADKNTYVTNLSQKPTGNGFAKDPSLNILTKKSSTSQSASQKGSELSSLRSGKKSASILNNLPNSAKTPPRNKEVGL